MSNNNRRLVAIMFTDMVGYSAIAQKNEYLAIDLLEEHRRILRKIFPKYDGKEIETVGDAFFVEFSSALEAVSCGVEIQKTLFNRNKSMKTDNKIRIRIGVHIGDVVHRGKNVLGDGVNIAARIEPLAETGGIAISQDVARQIQNKIGLTLEKLDSTKLKNIQLPMDIYAVVLPWLVKNQKSESTQKFIPSFPTKRIKQFLLIILALVIITMSVFISDSMLNNSEEKNSIAVLPFSNLSEKIENEYFSDGITEDVITLLSKIEELKVISRTSVMQYKNTEKNLIDIGNELNVANILEGSVRREDNKVRIAAQLIDAKSDKHLWAETYDEELTQIFAIQSKVAEQIAKSLKAKISPSEKTRIETKATDNLEAYDLYLKGRHHLNKRLPDEIKKAIEYFEQAIKKDSTYALAYTGLSDSYIILGNYNLRPPHESFPKAKGAAQKALKYNDKLAEAHTSLAYAILYNDWDWVGAEREFKNSIELNPSYAQTYGWYGMLLTLMGRFKESMEMRKIALELDPFSAVINADIGLELYLQREFDLAIEQINRTLIIDPVLGVLTYIPLGSSFLQKSMYDDALKAFSTMSMMISKVFPQSHPIPIAALGYAYAISGRNEDARNMLELLLEKSSEEYVSPYWIAIVYTGLSEYDNAFKWLEKALEEKDSSMVFLKVIPIFDPIRNDPRFKKILKNIGFKS